MRQIFVLILVSILTHWRTTFANLDGFKIYELVPETRDQCDLLHELSSYENFYDFFSLSKLPKKPVRVLVNPNEEKNFLEFLSRHGFTNYEMLHEFLAESVDIELNASRVAENKTPLMGKGKLSTERYYTHDEINNYIDDLAKRYPKRVFVKAVGKSFLGRVIKTIRISNGDGHSNKKVIFVDGGFHAREWISPAAVLYIIDQLVENFAVNADLLLDHDWVILPVVNPDGYEHSQTSTAARIWRKTRQPYNYLGLTCYGADLNRNFDFHWNEEGASSLPCMEMYAGPKAFSEPEAIIVRDLMHSLSDRGVMYLTIHSFGQYLLYPWGWTSDLPDTWQDLDEVASAGRDAIFNATGTLYEVGSSTNVLYIAAGASDDYGFIAGFPISITMELPGGGVTGFDPPASRIDELVKETWIGIHAMAKKVIEKY